MSFSLLLSLFFKWMFFCPWFYVIHSLLLLFEVELCSCFSSYMLKGFNNNNENPTHKLSFYFFQVNLFTPIVVLFIVIHAFFSYSQMCIVKLNVLNHLLLCCNIPAIEKNHGKVFFLLMAILFFSRLNFVLNLFPCVLQGCNNMQQ